MSKNILHTMASPLMCNIFNGNLNDKKTAKSFEDEGRGSLTGEEGNSIGWVD